MAVETVTSLASPWPLKVVLDSVLDDRPIPAALSWVTGGRRDGLLLLNLAAAATILIALLQAASAYAAAFYAVSIGQWIAHDLRQSVYAHLQRLSTSYDDRQQRSVPSLVRSPTTSRRCRISPRRRCSTCSSTA